MGSTSADRLTRLPGAVPLPLSCLVPLAALAFQLIVACPLAVTAALIEGVAFAAIVFLQRRPELRRWKYEAITAGIWGFGLDGIVAGASLPLVLLWSLAPLLASLCVLPLQRALSGSGGNGGETRHLARRTYALTHHAFSSAASVLIFVVIAWSGAARHVGWTLLALLCLMGFAPTRFLAGEALARSPVLYLRAFSSKPVFRVFNKIIAPSISRMHVIVGLTPAAERRKLVRKSVGMSMASLYVVPDDVWRAWVQRELARAHAVVFDLSVPTENLSWEIAEARRLCSGNRISVLIRAGAAVDLPESTTRIVLEKPRAARKALRSWLLGLDLAV